MKENYLLNYKGAVILVSHDRYFLDRVTNKTLMLRYRTAKLYHGAFGRGTVEPLKEYFALLSEKFDLGILKGEKGPAAKTVPVKETPKSEATENTDKENGDR